MYIHNGILLILEKDGNSDTCYNLDEPGGHYAKWTKPDRKRQVLYDCICVMYLEQPNSQKQRVEWWWPGAEG